MSILKFPIKLSTSIVEVVASPIETEASLEVVDVGLIGLEVVDNVMVVIFVVCIVDVVEVLGEVDGIDAEIGTVPEGSIGIYS